MKQDWATIAIPTARRARTQQSRGSAKMPPPTIDTDAAKEEEKLTQARVGRSRRVRCRDMVIPLLRIERGFDLAGRLRSGHGGFAQVRWRSDRNEKQAIGERPSPTACSLRSGVRARPGALQRDGLHATAGKHARDIASIGEGALLGAMRSSTTIRPQPLIKAVASSTKVIAISAASGCIWVASELYEQCSKWISEK